MKPGGCSCARLDRGNTSSVAPTASKAENLRVLRRIHAPAVKSAPGQPGSMHSLRPRGDLKNNVPQPVSQIDRTLQGWRFIARKQACMVRRGSASDGRRAFDNARLFEARIQALMRLSGLTGQLFGVLALIVAYYIGPELDNLS